MRLALRGLAAAAVGGGALAAVAAFSAARLATTPARGRLAPDPLGSLLSLAAFVVGIAAFVWLGDAIGRDGGRVRASVVTGALAGAATGLTGGVAQSIALTAYLGGVLARYAVPDEFLPIVLATYVAIAAIVGTAIGVTGAYFGWRHGRGRPA